MGEDMKHDDIIGAMTLEEKIAFCSGASFWKTEAYPQYGIPSLFLADGPHGLRKQGGEGDHLGLNASVSTTCFPTASAAASTWNPALLRKMGDALGKEARREDVNIILGPGVNMKRNPLCGRNFEYYSEDPYLSGVLAAAWVDGVQRNGVGTSLKHYAANNQEAKRMNGDSLVDERALREYYLPAFEMAVKLAQPTTVMCAYNKLDGVHCSDNKRLLWDILREEWGFEGAVVTDWGATNDRIAGFRAGLDLEMPGSKGRFDAEVKAAVESGELDEALIDATVERLLRLIDRVSPPDAADVPDDLFEKHHLLAREIAAEAGVLLKNEAGTLPLEKSEPVLVIGALAEKPRYQGAGSSQVTPTRLDSLLEGMGEYSDDVKFLPGYSLRDEADPTLLKQAVEQASDAPLAVLCLGLTDICESEGYDRTTMSIPQNQIDLLEAVSAVNANIIVVLVGGSAVTMPWLGKTKALLHMQLAGQAGGTAVADLLYGVQNPSGKLAESYPLRYEDVISSSYYGKNPRHVPYYESLYCGYRYFDTAQKEVLFPFGFGLSYTSFAYSGLRIEHSRDYECRVTFTVSNTGGRPGAEAAQLYVAAKTGGAFRPAQELKGFAKVFLNPGESKEVSLTLDKRSFAIYDPAQKDWIVETGEYEIRVGTSSRDISLSQTLALEGEQPHKCDCSPWYYDLDGVPGKADFVTVYGEYADYVPATRGSYDMSSTINEMKETSLMAKISYRVIEKELAKPYGGKADYGNVHFKMLMDTVADNPMKNLTLFSPDSMPVSLARFMVDTANGHLLRGLVGLMKGRKKP